MTGTHIYFACPAKAAPTGGIRMIYRQVDILNRHGIAASVLHQEAGFRCNWFENTTPVAYSAEVAFQPQDVLVLPEIATPAMFQIAPGMRKVIFNQNCYYTFLSWEVDRPMDRIPYLMPDVRGAIVVSEDSRQYFQYAFPSLPVYRLHYAIDPALYRFEAAKKHRIALMPRKNAGDAAQVMQLLRLRGSLGDFQFSVIENVSESAAAAMLREALVFLSFGYPEGFGLPPAEAMACGCLTVGYHGMGGREFFHPEFSFPIEGGDILAFARTVETLLKQYLADPAPLDVQRRRAAQFIESTYTPAQEERDILAAWRALLA